MRSLTDGCRSARLTSDDAVWQLWCWNAATDAALCLRLADSVSQGAAPTCEDAPAATSEGAKCGAAGGVSPAADLRAFGRRRVIRERHGRVAGCAVGAEGACGWWLLAPALELGAALERRSDECCPVAVQQLCMILLDDLKAALWQPLASRPVVQPAAGEPPCSAAGRWRAAL